MKTLVCRTPGHFDYQTDAYPTLQPNHAIVRVRRIGICGTDLHAFEGTQPFFNYPRVLGHELAGDLVEIDGRDDLTIGESVTIMPYFYCGHCIACRAGRTNCCERLQVSGVHIDGGMTEYLMVPAYALLPSNGLTHDQLALIEPLSIGAHAVRRANVQPGEHVAVVGAGPIGLGVMMMARLAGAQVTAIDLNDTRLVFCRDHLQVTHTINPLSQDTRDELQRITQGDMPTAIFEATGSLKAIEHNITYLAHGGRYILVGLQKGNFSFSHPDFHKKEATLMSSRNATLDDFSQVINAIKTGQIDPNPLITHRVAFNQVKDEFAGWLNPKNGVIKAMVSLD